MRPTASVEIAHFDWLLQFGGVLIRLRDHVTHGYLGRIAPPQIATIHHLASHPIIRLYALVNALAVATSY